MKSTFLTVLVLTTVSPLAALGQSASAPLNDVQESGMQLFQRRCQICHTYPTLTAKQSFARVLYNDIVEGNEASARATISKGRPGEMPGFQYGLEPEEIDSIVEYLKTLEEPPKPRSTGNPETHGTPTVSFPSNLHTAPPTHLLTGSIKSGSGEKMGGVMVSAKAEQQSITTSVFTDEQGDYYFPLLPAAKYKIWAQADTYETAKSEIDLRTAVLRNDFVLKPMKDFVRQLTGDQLLSALPEHTPEDRRMKEIFEHDCTGCHQPNYILQNRFDEDGWTAIIDLMKREGGEGILKPADKSTAMIQHQENELAPYLARMRGPGPSPMEFKLKPRPTGETARVVFVEYDVPVDWSWDKGIMSKYGADNGSDWSIGTPSSLNGMRGVHDAQADLKGNIWFTNFTDSITRTIGKIDANTGEVKSFAVPGADGLAARSHAMVRDQQGILWFHVDGVSHAESIASVNPQTEKIEVFTPPNGMEEIGEGGTTMDVDPKGNIWVSGLYGILRFDARTHQFIDFESNTKLYEGEGKTYGVAADREGNGWWAQFESGLDTVEKGEVRTGKTLDIKLPPVPGRMELFSEEDRELYAGSGSNLHAAYPWAQGPRRLGADQNGDFVWVCDYWGGNVAKIDIKTLKYTLIPYPNIDAAPYSAVVDRHHNIWVTLENTGAVAKFDPKTSRWTEYPLPSLGADPRLVSLLEKDDGTMQVLLPYGRSSRIALMTFRSEADLHALKSKVQSQTQGHRQMGHVGISEGTSVAGQQ
jgi:streptogramin lyase/mono/diheme cytochrome c family protein